MGQEGDAMMQVGELAERAGVSVRSIRHYEGAGLLRAKRRPNGYREFDDGAVTRVRTIRDLIDTGFTVEEIASLSSCLDGTDGAERCSARTAALYRRKLVKIEAQQRTLAELRRRIEARLATLEP
ncbi:MAG TPA: MerR family transcriptional regulator [Gemmatimonadaceae bacterium]|nr:MerR family transcriptional regulator [Gemmatimonadaceae bacterium]